MKTKSLLPISLAVLFVFAPRLGNSETASLTRTRSLQYSFRSFAKEDDILLDQPLLEEGDESEEPAVPPMDEDVCIPERNTWRPGNTYNDPSTLITSTGVECCDICTEEDRCIVWSRDRRTGACALKDEEAAPVREENYDSGVIEGTVAQNVVPLGECYREDGIAYTGGDVLMRRQTGSMTECCELCRDNRECYSWHRNRRSGRCMLNRNVPDSVSGRKNFAGAAMV